jgi:hypothetical protein
MGLGRIERIEELLEVWGSMPCPESVTDSRTQFASSRAVTIRRLRGRSSTALIASAALRMRFKMTC